MKMKCPECGTGKARRQCPRRHNAEICSSCCAAIRNEECGDCVHYEAVRQHAERRLGNTRRRDGHFFTEISDEINNAVNNAIALAQSGNPTKAMSILTDLLPAHPRSHVLYFGIGTIHVVEDNRAEAIKWFEKSIAIFPYGIEAHYNKAACHQQLMDLPNMVYSYRKVVEHGDPKDPDVRRARSIVEDLAKSVHKFEGMPLDDYIKALETFNRGVEKMDQGDFQGALERFASSSKINKRSAPCHGNMGICHAYLGHKAEALAELGRALEINPDYTTASNNLKQVEQMKEDEPLMCLYTSNASPLMR